MEKTNTDAIYQQALDAIRDEMARHAGDGAIGILGEFFTELLLVQPEIAPKLITDKKSLRGGMEAMKALAAKNKSGSWAAVDFFSGVNCVLKYYGLERMEPCQIQAVMMRAAHMEQSPDPMETSPTPQAGSTPGDEFDLDALLDSMGG